MIGELSPAFQKRFGINERVTLFELELSKVIPHATKSKTFKALPEFPSVKRDVAFVLPRAVEHCALLQAFAGAHPLLCGSEVFDVYEGQGIPEGKKSMAWHLEFRAPDRTLTSGEVEGALSTIVEMLEKSFHATMRL